MTMMQRGRSVLLWASLYLALCTGCTASRSVQVATSATSATNASPSTGSSRGASRSVVPTVTPSPAPTGTYSCYAWTIEATSPSGTVGLVACPGIISPVETVKVKTGDEVLISTPHATAGKFTVTATPPNLVEQSGVVFIAKAPGTTTLVIPGWLCAPNSRGQQPKSCPLVRITAN